MSSVKCAIFDSDDGRTLCDLYIPWLVSGFYHGLYTISVHWVHGFFIKKN